MRSWKRDFTKQSPNIDQWYDIYEDWGLIESSIAAQYGIRLRAEPDMTWDEFITLLSGILPETPLGYVVGIRSENNREKINAMTPDQRSIRSAWRNKMAKQAPKMDSATTVKEVQRMIVAMFGGGGDHVR